MTQNVTNVMIFVFLVRFISFEIDVSCLVFKDRNVFRFLRLVQRSYIIPNILSPVNAFFIFFSFFFIKFYVNAYIAFYKKCSLVCCIFTIFSYFATDWIICTGWITCLSRNNSQLWWYQSCNFVIIISNNKAFFTNHNWSFQNTRIFLNQFHQLFD